MPPRQRTTFKNKKPTTTYSYVEDRPTSASERLNTFIKSNSEGDNRNTQQSSVNEVVLDMPTKFQSKFKGVNNYNDMNSAQKMIFDFYDNRNKYQRDMNNLRTSSPEMMKAYAQRFPVSNFAMNMGPTIAGAMTGMPLGLLERGFDATKRGFNFAKSGAGRGLDAILSGIDTGLGAVEGGLDSLSGDTGNMIQDTGEIIKNTGGDLKDDAIDIFQEAIAKREEPSTFTVQNRPGDGANFREGFDSFLIDVPRQEVERLDPLANTKLSEPTGEYFDTSRGFPQMNAAFMPIIGETPEQTFARVTNRANFNEGGLASLNNPDYNMLMGASNFGF
tara:strand:+ start:304 stop:1299 length:996 start_codon:yes stop_codon:yes gene_type:complete